MTPLLRWCLVAAVAVAAVAVPLLPRLVPATASDVTAGELLSRVQASGERPYSGYVETAGAVQLAVGDDFSDLGDLVGDRLRLRVWWDGEDAWRVNRLLLTGEEDLVHDGSTTITYDYERARAVRARDPEIRLPRASDLVPPSLARITTEGATADEVSRLPARRIAGTSAPGLRLDPASEATSIDHVDLWVDEETGLALRVEVYVAGAEAAVLTTGFEEFTTDRPESADVAAEWSGQVEQERAEVLDLADAADTYAPFRVPGEVAGLERRATGGGAVGVYGGGVTRLIAVPLRESDADGLREALLTSPTAVVGETGTSVQSGPLSVFLTSGGPFGDYVLAGTVTPETVEQAAEDVLAGVRVRRELR